MVSKKIDIVELINSNPLIKLSGVATSSLINKIKEIDNISNTFFKNISIYM